MNTVLEILSLDISGLGLPNSETTFLTTLELQRYDPECDNIITMWRKRSLVITADRLVKARRNTYIYFGFFS